MSMLAERKRKQKWSLNPRGNDWSKDSNKFGQRLMERMGWKEGKGLGANEDGATEHVRVGYKNDSKGIGFKESIEWSFQQDNFSTLLNELNDNNITEETPSKVTSLEEKSEKSRARVHYRKFTRGKDLSRYSEKDLANILGRRKLKTTDRTIQVKIDSDPMPSQTPQFGVNTTTGGSMIEYFKNKLPNFISSKNTKVESESETEISHGFGYTTAKTDSDPHTSSVPGKKKRKLDGAYGHEEIPLSKKRKGQISELKSHGLINPGFDPISRTVITRNKHILETISEINENSPEPVKQKKIKVHSCKIDEAVETNQLTIISEACNDKSSKNNLSEINNKTKRKKRKNINECENHGVNNPSFNINEIQVNPNPFDSTVILSKHIIHDGEEDTNVNSAQVKFKTKRGDSCNLHNEADPVNLINSVKKTKSKQKRHYNSEYIKSYEMKDINSGCNDLSNGFDNAGFVGLDTVDKSSFCINNAFEIKTPKKLKRNQKGIANPSFDDTLDIPNDNCSHTESTLAKKIDVKIKNKHKKNIDRIDNASFTSYLNLNEEADLGNDERNDDHKIEKKIKKKKNRVSLVEQNYSIEDSVTLSVDKIKTKRKKKRFEIESCDIEATINAKSKANAIVNVTSNTSTVDEIEVGVSSGIDNPALNLNDSLNIDDCDLILNVTDEPVPVKPVEVKKNKNVCFSKINTKYVLEDTVESPEDIAQKKELFDINNKVFEASSTNYKKLKGLDNAAFNFTANVVKERVNSLAQSLENCQAEVENGINESKVKRVSYQERMIGGSIDPNGEDEPHPNGVIFKFKNANFTRKAPHWEKTKDLSVSYPKKSYKHLVKGDIVVGFKNTNLHQINGYGKSFKNKLRVI